MRVQRENRLSIFDRNGRGLISFISTTRRPISPEVDDSWREWKAAQLLSWGQMQAMRHRREKSQSSNITCLISHLHYILTGCCLNLCSVTC